MVIPASFLPLRSLFFQDVCKIISKFSLIFQNIFKIEGNLDLNLSYVQSPSRVVNGARKSVIFTLAQKYW